MTGPEHYRMAEQLAKQADEWMDADIGWRANLSTEERIARRRADLGAAQVHATLALAAAAAIGFTRFEDNHEWSKVAGVDLTGYLKERAAPLSQVDGNPDVD